MLRIIYSLLAHNVSLIKIGAEYSIRSTSIKITFNTSMYILPSSKIYCNKYALVNTHNPVQEINIILYYNIEITCILTNYNKDVSQIIIIYLYIYTLGWDGYGLAGVKLVVPHSRGGTIIILNF